MTDYNVSVAASGDDGYAQTSGSSFNNSNDYCSFGNQSGILYRAFFRFASVSVPKDAVVSSAVLRFRSYLTGPNTTLRTNIYIEADDDPSAPSSGANLIGRSLGSAFAWDGESTWSTDSTYDTDDFNAIAQTHFARAGWASGQALTVHVRNDGSSTNAYRRPKSYDLSDTLCAELRITYESDPTADVSDSLTVTESVDVDLFVEGETEVSEDITVTESATVEVEQLLEPSLDDDITVTESATVELETPQEVSKFETVEVSESITASLSVDVPTEAQSVELTENLDVALDIPTSWLALASAGLAVERYYFTLTGAADSTTDLEIPISSFQARKRTGEATYLSVVIPDYTGQAAAVTARSNGEMVIEMRYEYGGETSIRQEIVRAELEDIQTSVGGRNRSIILTGHKTQTFINRSVTLENSIYRAVSSGRITHRFAKGDPYLNPGDTAIVGSDTLVVDYVSFTVSSNYKVMEIRET